MHLSRCCCSSHFDNSRLRYWCNHLLDVHKVRQTKNRCDDRIIETKQMMANEKFRNVFFVWKINIQNWYIICVIIINIIYIYIYAHSEAFELIDRQNKDIHLTQICGHTCHQYLTDIYSNILLDNIPFDTNNPTGFIGNRKQFRHQVTWQYNVQLKETKEQSNYCGLQTSFRHAHCPTVQLFCWCYWN